MRVIAGSARSLPLKTIEGTDTRPTQDRIKETLFNMLSQIFQDVNFLIYILEAVQLELKP